MKNKVLTYLLAAFVLIIWGTIFYKIFFHSDEMESTPDIIVPTMASEQSDTTHDYHLCLDYPDPFIRVPMKRGEKVKQAAPISHGNKSVASNKNRTSPSNPTANAPVNVVWPPIKYEGSIKSNQKTTAIITVNGNTSFLAQGQTFMEVKIESITRDSLIVSYKNQKKTIRK